MTSYLFQNIDDTSKDIVNEIVDKTIDSVCESILEYIPERLYINDLSMQRQNNKREFIDLFSEKIKQYIKESNNL